MTYSRPLLTSNNMAGLLERPLACMHGARKNPARISLVCRTIYRINPVPLWPRAIENQPTTFLGGRYGNA